MKTIRPPKGTKHYELTCKNDKCHAKMECAESDLEFKADPRDGDAWVMKCPHCKTETWINVSEIRKYAVAPSH